jgi:hypothetical protein
MCNGGLFEASLRVDYVVAAMARTPQAAVLALLLLLTSTSAIAIQRPSAAYAPLFSETQRMRPCCCPWQSAAANMLPAHPARRSCACEDERGT